MPVALRTGCTLYICIFYPDCLYRSVIILCISGAYFRVFQAQILMLICDSMLIGELVLGNRVVGGLGGKSHFKRR